MDTSPSPYNCDTVEEMITHKSSNGARVIGKTICDTIYQTGRSALSVIEGEIRKRTIDRQVPQHIQNIPDSKVREAAAVQFLLMDILEEEEGAARNPT